MIRSKELIVKSLGAKKKGGEWKKGGMEIHVAKIARKTGLSQPLVSYHLREMGGMVVSERRHPRVYYRLSEKFEEIANRKVVKPLILGKNQQKVLDFISKNEGSRPKEMCPGMCKVTLSITLRSLKQKLLVKSTRNGRASFYETV